MNTPPDIPVAESQRLIAKHHVPQGRRYAKAVALMALAVLAGIIIGVGGTVLYFNKKLHRVPPRPDAIAQAIVNRLRELVALTPDEEKSVQAIVDVRMKEVDDIRKNSFQDIRDAFDNLDEDLTPIIGAERVQKWKDYKEMRSKEKRRRRHDDRSENDRKKNGHPN